MPGLLRHLARRSALHAGIGFPCQAATTWTKYTCHLQPIGFYREAIRYTSSKDGCCDDMCLFNSLSESVDPLPASSTERKGLAWYTCGPTTYAPAHMGHARTYVCMDILRRIVEESNASSNDTIPPLFVMNITDVDDKILAASDQTGEAPLDIARRYEVEFWDDLESLNCLKPNLVTRVSEHVVSDIVPYIEKLAKNGMTYELDDGIYFDIQAYNFKLDGVTQYGKLAPSTASDDTSSTLTTSNTSDKEDDSIKRDERDFALWKKKRTGEAMAWESPWGEGRPGWHIECSAMIEAVQTKFRDTHEFRVHAGGADLKFPHHTNEIAQAEGYRQKADWIPHWVHTGHLHIDGLKMSKSLKNFVSIRDFLNSGDLESEFDSPADDFRLWCLSLSGSYRDPATFSMDRIIEAQRIRAKLVRFLTDSEDWLVQSNHSSKVWTQQQAEILAKGMMCRTAAMKALRNDLEGRAFLDRITEIVSMGHSCLVSTADTPPELVTSLSTMVRSMLRIVGMSTRTTGAGLRNRTSGIDPSQMDALVDAMVDFRDKIREQALSGSEGDGIRQQEKTMLAHCDNFRDVVLPKLGVQILDGESARWKRVISASPHTSSIKHTHQSNQLDLSKVPIDRIFRVGRFENIFSEFDDEGIPTLTADGTEISKRAMKKLLKKREKHLLLLHAER